MQMDKGLAIFIFLLLLRQLRPQTQQTGVSSGSTPILHISDPAVKQEPAKSTEPIPYHGCRYTEASNESNQSTIRNNFPRRTISPVQCNRTHRSDSLPADSPRVGRHWIHYLHPIGNHYHCLGAHTLRLFQNQTPVRQDPRPQRPTRRPTQCSGHEPR